MDDLQRELRDLRARIDDLRRRADAGDPDVIPEDYASLEKIAQGIEHEIRARGGVPATAMHVAVADGVATWFTDCGEPFDD